MANVSTTSFGTPVSAAQKRQANRPYPAEKEPQPEDPVDDLADEDEVDDVLGDADDTEPTVVFTRAFEVPAANQASSPEPAVEAEEVVEAPAFHPPEPAVAATPHHRQKVKVTTELERIVVRLTLLWKMRTRGS